MRINGKWLKVQITVKQRRHVIKLGPENYLKMGRQEVTQGKFWKMHGRGGQSREN
jgi:hypothetical protein